MWRYDAGRTAATPEELPAELHLQWVMRLPTPKSAWPWTQYKLLYDASYEPVAAGDLLFVASMVRDSVTAYDARTGAERWRFFAEGPVRFAPVAANGKVYFASDDGCLYCLNAGDGSLVFKFDAAPKKRLILGNERVISTWPARGAPVLLDGVIYFSAGVWPVMGTYLYALDAETGDVIWENSGSGAAWILQPHNSPSFAGVGPQGYSAAVGDKVLFSGGRSAPAAYDRATGEFLYYHHGWAKSGGYSVTAREEWFINDGNIFRTADGADLTRMDVSVVTEEAMIGVREGGLFAYALEPPKVEKVKKLDKRGNEYEETRYSFRELWRDPLDPLLDRVFLQAGSRVYGSGPDGVIAAYDLPVGDKDASVSWQGKITGEAWNMLAANGRLFVVTREGLIYCFAGGEVEPRRLDASTPPPATPAPNDEWTALAKSALEQTGVQEGYALVLGLQTGRLAEELVTQSELRVIGVDPDPARVDGLRRRFAKAGLYGERLSLLTGDLTSLELPLLMANLIVTEDPARAGLTDQTVGRLYESLRPYGGVALLTKAQAGAARLKEGAAAAKLASADVTEAGGNVLLRRLGPLPGAGSWTHQYGDAANTVFSRDSAVKAPLGILWFGGPSHIDVLPRHGHGPPPQVIGGRLFIEGIDSLQARDVYTGRVLWLRKFEDLGTFGAYYDASYNPDPYTRVYNQSHIPGANAVGANYVATPEAVYIVAGPNCYALDPATGNTVKTLRLREGDDAPNFGYIGAVGDYLITGAAPLGLTDEKTTRNDEFGVGSKSLVALNRHTGERLWSRPAVYEFRHNTIVIGAQKVFAIDGMSKQRLELLKRRGAAPEGEPTLMALDLQTGAEVWSTTENVFGTWLGYSEEHDVLIQGGSRSGDRAGDEVGSGILACKGSDGTVLWKDDRSYLGPPILHHDLIITQVPYGTRTAGPAFVLNLLTGDEVQRTHPMTGESVPWNWVRFYGCNTAIASENLLTFRSAAASFVDLTRGQGTSSLGGFKSSCTSNLVVADGVVNAPDYTRTCTCSYQNQSSLAFVHEPDVEIWSFDYYPPPETPTPVTRVGLNLGAPGNRHGDDGTLFLEVPSVGGPSPDIPVRLLEGEPKWFRAHASEVEGELDWVAASGLKGAVTLAIRPFLQPDPEDNGRVEAYERNAFTLDLANGEPQGAFEQPQAYTVRLYFSEPEDRKPGERVFTVALQGQEALADFDITQAAGGPRRSVMKEFRGVQVQDDLTISLTPAGGSQAPPVLCGIELVAE